MDTKTVIEILSVLAVAFAILSLYIRQKRPEDLRTRLLTTGMCVALTLVGSGILLFR